MYWFLSSGDGGLSASVALMILHLLLDQPAEAFLPAEDDLISIDGLGLLTSSSCSQLEEKHQQCISSLLSQYSQYQPINFELCTALPSKSVWGMTAVWVGVSEDWWWIPKFLAGGNICFRSVVFCVYTSCLVRYSPLFWFCMTLLGLFQCVELFLSGVSVLGHGEFSPCGLHLDFYL